MHVYVCKIVGTFISTVSRKALAHIGALTLMPAPEFKCEFMRPAAQTK